MALTWQWHGRKDSVTLPAVATFAAVIAVVAVLVLVRYVRLPSTRKLSSTVKNAGTGVRRSTRERTKVDRWSPPRVGTPKSTKDSPSTKRPTRTSVTETVNKVVAAAEDVVASPVSAIKQSRLSKSLGATATSPSPPKTRSRATPKKA